MNIVDVVWAVNIILGLIEPATSQLWAVDCNGDENVNIVDAIGIVNVVLGIGQCASGACRMELTPEVMEFFETLKPYFSSEVFDRFMALLRESRVPSGFSLSQNYPNPFNPSTTIHYQIPDARVKKQDTGQTHQDNRRGSYLASYLLPLVSLKIYNILGQEVRTLVDAPKESGYHAVTWDGKDSFGHEVASGVYFYRLSVDGGKWSKTRRMVLMR